MNQRVCLLIAICLSTFSYAQQANFDWAISFGAGNFSDAGESIAVDGSGDVYTIGTFRGTIDFDPGPGLATLTSAGSADVFVQKLDPSGNLVWAKSFGGALIDHGYSITVDGLGNVYTTGSFQGTVDFDPGPGLATLTSAGSDDVFIQKLDPLGNLIWVKAFGGGSNDIGRSIALDAAGNIYSTGWFQGTVDFDPGPGIASLTSAGAYDVFIQKLDVSGNLVWGKAFGGSFDDFVESIAVDSLGNVFTTGSFWTTADFDPGPGTFNLTPSGFVEDVFIQKLDANGSFLWAKAFGGTSNDQGYSLAVDASGNVYTTGYFAGTVDFDPGAGTFNLSSRLGSRDVFIEKLDANGNFLWAKAFGGSDGDRGLSIAVDTAGNVYTTGYFRSFVDFDPGVGTTFLSSVGRTDVFIQKLDTNGDFLWAQTFGDIQNDQGNSIVVDVFGNIYTIGCFIGPADFDPGIDTFYLTSPSPSSPDVFVQKLNQCVANTGIDVITACDSYTWIDGQTYTASNDSATFTLMNAAGCDSLVTLDLTINNSTTGTDVITACDSYTWIDGNTYTAGNNTATFTLTNAAGCDSVVTLDLTINNSTTGTDVMTACDSYTWIDGNTYTSSNNTATFTLTNVAGCDSVVTLDLTINNSTTGTDVITACDSYTWIDGQTYTASNDSATFTLMNAAGCDSLVTLDLTINNSSTGIDVITACDSYTWIDGTTYTSSNNTAMFTLTNAAGCDSVVTLDLTINSVSDITTSLIGVTITATNSNATYQWLDCDNGFAPISGETNQSFMATANGNYAVELTENGCVDTSACVSITTVGITENSFGDAFAVYPNPTSGNFSINLGAFYDHAEVRITDVLGSIIQTKSIPETQQIDLSITSPSGLYIVTVDAGEKRAIIRVVKE